MFDRDTSIGTRVFIIVISMTTVMIFVDLLHDHLAPSVAPNVVPAEPINPLHRIAGTTRSGSTTSASLGGTQAGW